MERLKQYYSFVQLALFFYDLCTGLLIRMVEAGGSR